MEILKHAKYWHNIRLLLLISSILLMVTSMFLIAFGAEMYHTVNHSKMFIDSKYIILVIALMGDGLALFFSSIICYCGAKHYKSVFLKVATLALTAAFIINLFIIIYGLTEKTDIEESTRNLVVKLLSQYGYDDETTNTWDATHEQFYCCGATYPEDWKSLHTQFTGTVIKYNGIALEVPHSCCTYYDCSQDGNLLVGCLQRITEYVTKCFYLIVYLPAAVAILQILAIIISTILSIRLKRINSDEALQPIITS